MTDLAVTPLRLHQRQLAGSGRLVVGWAALHRGVGAVRPAGARGIGRCAGDGAALVGRDRDEPSRGDGLSRNAATRFGDRREQDDIGAGPVAGGRTP